MARINGVSEDESNRYDIGNGIKCSVYLDLTLTYQEGNPLNKKYRITHVSNSVLQQDEWDRYRKDYSEHADPKH